MFFPEPKYASHYLLPNSGLSSASYPSPFHKWVC